MKNEIIEKLAEREHKSWSSWMTYLFSKCSDYTMNVGMGKTLTTKLLPEWGVENWQRQIDTPYDDLSEEEKDSDRKEAREILSIVDDYIASEIKTMAHREVDTLEQLRENLEDINLNLQFDNTRVNWELEKTKHEFAINMLEGITGLKNGN